MNVALSQLIVLAPLTRRAGTRIGAGLTPPELIDNGSDGQEEGSGGTGVGAEVSVSMRLQFSEQRDGLLVRKKQGKVGRGPFAFRPQEPLGKIAVTEHEDRRDHDARHFVFLRSRQDGPSQFFQTVKGWLRGQEPNGARKQELVGHDIIL